MNTNAPPQLQGNQNRKLLEQLEEQKKRLRMQNQQPGTASASVAAATGAGTPGPAPVSSNLAMATDYQQMNPAQKAALQHAHANSVGYFITQDSAFGNLILPVLPRFDK